MGELSFAPTCFYGLARSSVACRTYFAPSICAPKSVDQPYNRINLPDMTLDAHVVEAAGTAPASKRFPIGVINLEAVSP
jgi:hypothetical protein